MKKCAAIVPLTLSASLLAGCAAGGYTPVKPANPSPSAGSTPQALEQATANGLVWKLLETQTGESPGQNVILSPLSVEMALAMAANAAAGQAKSDMETLLGMDAETLNALLGPYLTREDETVFLANSMWFQQALESQVSEAFKDCLARIYQAEEGTFTPYSAASAGRINAWVKEKTQEKISSIVDQDMLTEDILCLLINALYFDGRWAEPFEDTQLLSGTFHAPDGDEEATLMCQWVDTYFETSQAQGFSKAYEDGYEFIGILPREEGESGLKDLDLDAFLASESGAYDVDIRIPKFELEYTCSLRDTLSALGLESLFLPHALDGLLSAQAKADGLSAHVSDIIHKTYMRMYEEGTEAAAVTAVIAEATCAMPKPRETRQVWLDRPFAFLIRDAQSGQIVFCGQIHTLAQ